MRKKLKMQRHERMFGPHFDEEQAIKAVSKMENEDGTNGEHWSLSDTTRIAGQYGINLNTRKFNKYDWYVALNMVYSDYYKVINTISNSDHLRCFAKLAEAWLCDKDIEEGKMWYYYCFIMCDKLRDEFLEEDDEDEDEEEYSRYNYARRAKSKRRYEDDEYEDDDRDYRYERRGQMRERRSSRY